MGKGWEGIAASSRSSENHWLGTCKAHDVSISPEEDCSGAEGTLGEGKGAAEEESRLAA